MAMSRRKPAIQAVSKQPQLPVFEITTAEQQKAYFHPVRMKILNFLTAERLTVSLTAERLKVHPANITHHFRILQHAGLIHLVEERDIGRVIEKYYEAVARVFDVRPAPGEVEHVGQKVLRVLRDDLSGNIVRLKRDDSDALIGQLFTTRIDRHTYAEFAAQLTALIKAFEAAGADGGERYALNLSLYPQRLDYGPLRQYELNRGSRKGSSQ
jgi:DNA-binding transcriptional ArsR family regulator